jgi:hypothetical protein
MCMLTLIASLLFGPLLFASSSPNEDLLLLLIAISSVQALVGFIVFRALLDIFIEREANTISGGLEHRSTLTFWQSSRHGCPF